MPEAVPTIRRRIVGRTVPSGNIAGKTVPGLLLCILPVLGHAGEAPRPVPIIGSTTSLTGRLLTAECADWTVKGLMDDGKLVRTCGGYTLEAWYQHDFNPTRLVEASGKTLVEFRPYLPALSFPLSLGKRWHGQYVGFTAFNNLVWDGETRCEVAARETLTTAAGDFDSFRIECEDGWQVGPRKGSFHTTRWYAPSAGLIVKEVHARDPAQWNFELARLQLAPTLQAPPPAAPAASPGTPAASPASPASPSTPPAAPHGPEILDPNEY